MNEKQYLVEWKKGSSRKEVEKILNVAGMKVLDKVLDYGKGGLILVVATDEQVKRVRANYPAITFHADVHIEPMGPPVS